MTAINFNNMFDAFLAADEKEWKYDRNASVGASETFACIRMSFFKKHGYEQDDEHEDDWGAAKRGDIIENFFAVPATQAILPEDASLFYAGDEQETLRIGRSSATPDGLIVDVDRDALAELGIPDIESDCFVIEYKSFDPRANVKEEKSVHSGQTQMQMGLIHELTEFRPMYAVIVYFNASFLSDIRPFVVKFDPAIYEVGKQRNQKVFDTKEPTELQAEGKIDNGCSFCSYTEECAIAEGLLTPRDDKPIGDQKILDRLAILAKRQQEAKAREKEAEADAKQASAEIKEILYDTGTKRVSDDRFNVSLSWSDGKDSLDQLAMIDDGIDLAKYKKQGNGHSTLRVKDKSGD